MQEHCHRTIDQVNSTISIKKITQSYSSFQKDIFFSPDKHSTPTRPANTTNQKETYLIPSFNSSSPSAILFSSRVNVTIGRSPLRRGFEINLKKKKKKERKKERKTSDGTHLAHANWADFVQRRQKERERERERFVF